jgi:Flp pilus assembly protein CpaB
LLKQIKLPALLIGILILGLVCTVSVNESSNVKKALPVGEIVRVYATAIDMDTGESFDVTKIKIIEISADEVAGVDLVQDIELIRDQYAAQRLTVDSPITVDLLSATEPTAAAPTNLANSVTPVPVGYGVIAIESYLDPMLIGLLKSGCRVDVTALIKDETNRMKIGISRLATGVEFLQMSDESRSEDSRTALTLLVPQETVATIQLAMDLGTLHLSLTGAADQQDLPAGMLTTLERLRLLVAPKLVDMGLLPNATPTIKISDLPENQPNTPAVKPDELDAPEVVATVETPRFGPQVGNPPREVTQLEVYWKMEVMTPDGVTHYEWIKQDSDPTIIIAENFGATTTTK